MKKHLIKRVLISLIRQSLLFSIAAGLLILKNSLNINVKEGSFYGIQNYIIKLDGIAADYLFNMAFSFKGLCIVLVGTAIDLSWSYILDNLKQKSSKTAWIQNW